jgi:hypothetical protein
MSCCLDNYFLGISDSDLFHNRSESLRVRPMKKRSWPSGGGTQRRVRQPMPKPILPPETHNKAAMCRGKYAALFALPRKMNTAAVQNNMVDAIVLKKSEFDQIEAVEAALWLSTESAQQDGSDYKQATTKETRAGGCGGDEWHRQVLRQLH